MNKNNNNILEKLLINILFPKSGKYRDVASAISLSPGRRWAVFLSFLPKQKRISWANVCKMCYRRDGKFIRSKSTLRVAVPEKIKRLNIWIFCFDCLSVLHREEPTLQNLLILQKEVLSSEATRAMPPCLINRMNKAVQFSGKKKKTRVFTLAFKKCDFCKGPYTACFEQDEIPIHGYSPCMSCTGSSGRCTVKSCLSFKVTHICQECHALVCPVQFRPKKYE